MDDNEDDYDICVIDTGPSKGPNTAAAIHAASHMLIPVEMEQQSIEGLYGMIALRSHENLTRDIDSRLELVGVQPNKFKTQRKKQQVFLDELQRTKNIGEHILPHVMHDWTGYADDSLSDIKGGVSLMTLPPSNRVRREFEEVASVIEARIFQ